MKSIKIYSAVLFLMLLWISNIKAQHVPNGDDLCGVTGSAVTSATEDITGGRYKPSISNIGGAPAGEDYFPVLVLFVQFAGETGGSTSDINDWPGGSAPNFMSSTITNIRASEPVTSWWNSYNGYDVSDYWNEQSRGKLHVLGTAVSVILSHTEAWYYSNPAPGYSTYYGAQARMNKEIMDYIKQPSVGIDWPFYDKWTTNSDGSFTWAADGRVI